MRRPRIKPLFLSSHSEDLLRQVEGVQNFLRLNTHNRFNGELISSRDEYFLGKAHSSEQINWYICGRALRSIDTHTCTTGLLICTPLFSIQIQTRCGGGISEETKHKTWRSMESLHPSVSLSFYSQQNFYFSFERVILSSFISASAESEHNTCITCRSLLLSVVSRCARAPCIFILSKIIQLKRTNVLGSEVTKVAGRMWKIEPRKGQHITRIFLCKERCETALIEGEQRSLGR